MKPYRHPRQSDVMMERWDRITHSAQIEGKGTTMTMDEIAGLLIKYGNHRQGCDTRTCHLYPCSCGWIRVLDSAMAIAFGNRNKNPNSAIIERERKRVEKQGEGK
jgi:hypothetical protein